MDGCFSLSGKFTQNCDSPTVHDNSLCLLENGDHLTLLSLSHCGPERTGKSTSTSSQNGRDLAFPLIWILLYWVCRGWPVGYVCLALCLHIEMVLSLGNRGGRIGCDHWTNLWGSIWQRYSGTSTEQNCCRGSPLNYMDLTDFVTTLSRKRFFQYREADRWIQQKSLEPSEEGEPKVGFSPFW